MNASLLTAVWVIATFPSTMGLTMEAIWKETVWRGETAFEARTVGWRAIVSVQRGRLVHFGPVDDGTNLLYESPEATPYRRGGDFRNGVVTVAGWDRRNRGSGPRIRIGNTVRPPRLLSRGIGSS